MMTRLLLRLAALFGTALLVPFVPSGVAQTGTAQTAQGPTNQTQPALSGFPFTNESLSYTVNWPSGLSLGDGHLSATREMNNWRFELTLDASIPGFIVKDVYRASSGLDFCSATFSKDATHGTRRINETITVDKEKSTVTRHLTSGATSKATVPGCVRDALTYLFYAREELGQGRVPSRQNIIFGATYDAGLEYAGSETISVNEKRVLADKIVCHIKGPASDIQFDAYFDRDAARTPVAIRVPLPVGKISLELVR
jgi:hypothetical protein